MYLLSPYTTDRTMWTNEDSVARMVAALLNDLEPWICERISRKMEIVVMMLKTELSLPVISHRKRP